MKPAKAWEIYNSRIVFLNMKVGKGTWYNISKIFIVFNGVEKQFKQ